MASHGSHRRFQVRTSHGKVIKSNLSADQNLIDRSAGKIEQDTESELRDSRWSRLNDGGDQAAGFEKDRIAKLAEEREHIQKKTFTKWVNSHLNRVQQKIEDLYKDCRDGRALLVLLEILSGEKLPKAARGRMRIHCLENNEKVLSFLRLKKVKLENLGPADITDGNHRLTLGLIWTIILRFQIQEIDFIDENKEKRSAKDALLLWCQMKTSDYNNVNVVNFTTSWKNGLAFNAIIHKHLPELINYENLDANNAVQNLENAFKVAEEECEIPALLDAEDVAVEYPDEKSIITYLAQYYHYFSKLKQQQLEGKRIGGVLDDIVITQQLQNQYESLASELLKWIKTKTADMNKRDFKNSLEGIQSQLKEYDEYRKVEKPPKMDERANLEILLFDIQTKLRAANRKAYTPKEGQMINDINSAWPELEDAEYNREKALREQLQKQELLARTAVKFETKAEIRSAWIYENKKLVQDDDFGNSLATVNASIIKQNTLDDEIQAYEDRMKKLPEILEFLSSNNYHLITDLKETNSTVFQKWNEFLSLCQNRRDHLASLKDLHELLARCDEEELDLQEIKLGLDRDDYLVGMHLLECDDMIAKHNLVLKSLSTHEENIADIESHPKSSDQLVAAKIENLKSLLDSIKAQANQRSVKLEESRALHKFNEDADDHDTFLKLQQTALDNVDIGTDLNSVNNQINQFSEIEDDLTARSSLVEDTCKAGEKLVDDDHFAKDSILEKLDNLKTNWANLKDKADFTKSQLDNQKDLYQTLNDAENLAKEIDDKVQTLNDLNITDPNSAVSAGGISNLANKLAQMKEDFNSNILGNKIPALKERISNCDNEMTNRAMNEINNGVEDFEKAAKQKYSELKANKKFAKDLALILQNTAWCTEKLAIVEQVKLPDSIDQLNLVQRKVHSWNTEISQKEPVIEKLNTLSSKYDDPGKSIIIEKLEILNDQWNALKAAIDELKEKVKSKQSALDFGLNCDETIQSIDEKKRLAEKIAELENQKDNLDLNSVMATQKKLGKLDRDRDALKQRIKELEDQGAELSAKHPECAIEIQNKLDSLNNHLDSLDNTINEKRTGLGAAGALHNFIKELDDLENWVSKSLRDLDDADQPTTQQHALALQNQHDSLRAEIDSYEPTIDRVCKTGREIVAGRPDEDAMNHRLDKLASDFDILRLKANERNNLLENAVEELAFNREAKNLEQELEDKENFMKNQHDNMPNRVTDAENSLKQHSITKNSLQSMKPRVDKLTEDAEKSTIPSQSKMIEKASNIQDQYGNLLDFADLVKSDLFHNVSFATWNVECAHFNDWLKDRRAILKEHDEMTETGSVVAESVATGVSANDGMDIHRAFQKHRAFVDELKHNGERLKKIIAEGNDLKTKIPSKEQNIDDKINELQNYWDSLKKACMEREKKLFECSKAEILSKNVNELANFAGEQEDKITNKPLSSEDLDNLANIKRLLKDQEHDEAAMNFRKQELDNIAKGLAKELTGEDLQDMEDQVEKLRKRFDELEGPMSDRRKQLEAAKKIHELKRDILIELRWIKEKLASAQASNYGESLHAAQLLQARHNTLKAEVYSHQNRIEELLADTDIDDQKELSEKWLELLKAIDSREEKLKLSVIAQQYLFNAEEVQDWIGERELYLLGTESQKSDNEDIATRNIRRHAQHQQAINDYEPKIQELSVEADKIKNSNNPDAEICEEKQRAIESAFNNLKQLAKDRGIVLADNAERLKLNSEFNDFANWIGDREKIANSNDTGKNAADCDRLIAKNNLWAEETKTTGNDKLKKLVDEADRVLNNQPSAADEIQSLKNNADEQFKILLESIGNRNEILDSANALHKCLRDCADLTNRLNTKRGTLPKETGSETDRTNQLTKQHEADVKESQSLMKQAKAIDERANNLAPSYAGDESLKIASYRTNLNDAVDQLEKCLQERALKLKQTSTTHEFTSLASELLEWIEETNKKIDAQQRPDDKSQVDALLLEHSEIRSNMDSRKSDFEAVYKIQSDSENYLSDEAWNKVNSFVVQLRDGYSALESKWNSRNSYLLLAAGVTGFWRDCAHADAWLKSVEDDSDSDSPVDAKKALGELEQFEQSVVAPWNEKFKLLEKLTQYEELEAENMKLKRQIEIEEELKKEKDNREREIKNEKILEKRDSGERRQAPTAPKEVERKVEELRSETTSASDSVSKFSAFDTAKKTQTNDSSTDAKEASHSAVLNRKHEHANTGKKATNRSWHTLFCVLSGGRMLFFKDSATAGKASAASGGQYTGKQTWKGELPLDLNEATVEVATDYKKRSNVFRLRLKNGAEYLFQGATSDEMNMWVAKMKEICNEATPSERSSTVNSDKKSKSMFKRK